MQSEDNTPSIRRRRRASQNLSKLTIPTDGIDGPLPKLEEVKEEGRVLYTNFMMEQIRQEGIQQSAETLPSCTPGQEVSGISTPVGYKFPAWAKAGKRLRYMADEFSKTKERERIRNEANQRDLQDLNQESFFDFLTEFFNRGVTSDRILFLFFFCSDVAFRALRQKAVDLFRNLNDWSIQFIVERVSAWVQQNGGWAVVLNNSVDYLKIAMIGGMVMLAIFGVVKFFRGSSGGGSTATS